MIKNTLKTKAKSLIFSMVFILCCMSITDTKAQCTYLTITAEAKTALVELPCDFPVLNHVAATDIQKQEFQSQLLLWKQNNPGFESLTFTPEGGKSFIQIQKKDFDAFTKDRKEIILTSPSFYMVSK